MCSEFIIYANHVNLDIHMWGGKKYMFWRYNQEQSIGLSYIIPQVLTQEPLSSGKMHNLENILSITILMDLFFFKYWRTNTCRVSQESSLTGNMWDHTEIKEEIYSIHPNITIIGLENNRIINTKLLRINSTVEEICGWIIWLSADLCTWPEEQESFGIFPDLQHRPCGVNIKLGEIFGMTYLKRVISVWPAGLYHIWESLIQGIFVHAAAFIAKELLSSLTLKRICTGYY